MTFTAFSFIITTVIIKFERTFITMTEYGLQLYSVRDITGKDLDGALVWILKDTLEYLSNKDGEIDPMTQKTYDYYCKNKESI